MALSQTTEEPAQLQTNDWLQILSYLSTPSLIFMRQTSSFFLHLIDKTEKFWNPLPPPPFFPSFSILHSHPPYYKYHSQFLSLTKKICAGSSFTNEKVESITKYLEDERNMEKCSKLFNKHYLDLLQLGHYGEFFLSLPLFFSLFPIPFWIWNILCPLAMFLGCVLMIKSIWKHADRVYTFYRGTREKVSWMKILPFAVISPYYTFFHPLFTFHILGKSSTAIFCYCYTVTIVYHIFSPLFSFLSFFSPPSPPPSPSPSSYQNYSFDPPRLINGWLFIFLFFYALNVYHFNTKRKLNETKKLKIFFGMCFFSLLISVPSRNNFPWQITQFSLLVLVHPFCFYLRQKSFQKIVYSRVYPTLPLFPLLSTFLQAVFVPVFLVAPILLHLSTFSHFSGFGIYLVIFSCHLQLFLAVIVITFFSVYKLLSIGDYRWWWISYLAPSLSITIASQLYAFSGTTLLYGLIFGTMSGSASHSLIWHYLIGYNIQTRKLVVQPKLAAMMHITHNSKDVSQFFLQFFRQIGVSMSSRNDNLF